MPKETPEQTMYIDAMEYARDDVKFDEDTMYGCGSSFLTIKWGKFCRAMKKEGLVKKDGYYGWVVDTQSPMNGTLEDEKYKKAFAEFLSNNGEHAFVHTRLN